MCFFFNDTATTEIYTLSLHDALPISIERAVLCTIDGRADHAEAELRQASRALAVASRGSGLRDRKSTRLNSSHANISYAVFCLKKKKKSDYYSDTCSLYKLVTRSTHA